MRHHNTWCLLALVSQLSCATYESSLQTGRVLGRGTSSYGAALHYVVDYHDDFSPQHLYRDERINYGLASRGTGLSAQYRRGLGEGMDAGFSLSPRTSSLGLSKNLLSQPRVALGLNAKILAPIFSVDTLSSYWAGVLLPSSCDLLPGASVVVTPGYYYKPGGADQRRILALHSGVLLGQSRGIFLEWSLFQETLTTGERTNKEQLTMGLLTGLDNFERPPGRWSALAEATSLRPSFSLETPGLVHWGVTLGLPFSGWYPAQLWGSASLPVTDTPFPNRGVYMRSRYLGLRKTYLFSPSSPFGVVAGMAYRAQMADVGSSDGYQFAKVGVPVLSGGLVWQYTGSTLRILEAMYPLKAAANTKIYGAFDEAPSEETKALARRFAAQATVFILSGDFSL